MFYVSKTMAALWWFTGLMVKRTAPIAGPSSRLSIIYAASVYSAYAFLCAASASDSLMVYYGRGRLTERGNLQIRLIRDMDATLLFVATTTVHWSVAAYSREHGRVYDEHAVVARRLFGDVADCLPSRSSHRVMDACCWALYALLAVVLLLDVCLYMDPAAPWTRLVVYVWGHYVLLTGNIQFAVTVFGLRQCYRELNERMRAGRPERRYRDDLFDWADDGGWSAADATTSTLRSTSSDFIIRDVMFVSVLDKVNLLSMLKYWFYLHWSITQIVSMVNNLFKFRIFVFFLCGLMHLMLTPYLLSLTILNEDVDILSHIIERTLWFVIHIFRVVLMIYPCALLGDEASKTQIFLGSYLNTKMDFGDIKKEFYKRIIFHIMKSVLNTSGDQHNDYSLDQIETYVQQLNVNKPEFSIYSMFVIDRQLVITLTGTVATYLVIILQLQGQF